MNDNVDEWELRNVEDFEAGDTIEDPRNEATWTVDYVREVTRSLVEIRWGKLESWTVMRGRKFWGLKR